MVVPGAAGGGASAAPKQAAAPKAKGKAKAKAAPRGAASSSAEVPTISTAAYPPALIKRLNAEIRAAMRKPHPDIDVYITDSIAFWRIIMSGPVGGTT